MLQIKRKPEAPLLKNRNTPLEFTESLQTNCGAAPWNRTSWPPEKEIMNLTISKHRTMFSMEQTTCNTKGNQWVYNPAIPTLPETTSELHFALYFLGLKNQAPRSIIYSPNCYPIIRLLSSSSLSSINPVPYTATGANLNSKPTTLMVVSVALILLVENHY